MSASERPSERRGAARTAVVWETLRPILGDGDTSAPALDVLDIGGGTGGFAVRVAGLGHRVTVVDPNPDALASLARRAREEGVQVASTQGDLSDLAQSMPEAGIDLVLCHGVLELADDPAAALGAIARVLRPGGTLSLLVAQRNAAVVARAMAGHFGQAKALLDDDTASGRAGRRFTLAEGRELLGGAGFQVVSVHGIRVFADLVPGSLVDLESGAAAALVDLEHEVAQRPDYLPLATQLHLVATR
ncbi:methyltransferase domain-containing protein [Nocardioides insulae]|uniref:methyltransferase domain-containing protein n=1 Tax=Nocardioides insulae TaxID=394734 RepID=UPI00048D73C5|nr:methyltransferase domain-containing protein [Nocardioides insulae]